LHRKISPEYFMTKVKPFLNILFEDFPPKKCKISKTLLVSKLYARPQTPEWQNEMFL
jgi:hypothetical protein